MLSNTHSQLSPPQTFIEDYAEGSIFEAVFLIRSSKSFILKSSKVLHLNFYLSFDFICKFRADDFVIEFTILENSSKVVCTSDPLQWVVLSDDYKQREII